MIKDQFTHARRELTLYWDANHDVLVNADSGVNAGVLRERSQLAYDFLGQAWNTVRSMSLFNHIPTSRREDARIAYWKKNGREHCLSLLTSFEKGFSSND